MWLANIFFPSLPNVPSLIFIQPKPFLPKRASLLPSQLSARALPSIIILLDFAHYASFLLHGLIKLSLCNLTASLGLHTGAPAAFVVNHY